MGPPLPSMAPSGGRSCRIRLINDVTVLLSNRDKLIIERREMERDKERESERELV
jgi:hypothetical protein